LFLFLAIVVFSSPAIFTPADEYNNRLFSWLRGGAYLRNFKPARIFVAIFIQTIIDLSAFSIFLI
jgi:hypothetical protein